MKTWWEEASISSLSHQPQCRLQLFVAAIKPICRFPPSEVDCRLLICLATKLSHYSVVLTPQILQHALYVNVKHLFPCYWLVLQHFILARNTLYSFSPLSNHIGVAGLILESVSSGVISCERYRGGRSVYLLLTGHLTTEILVGRLRLSHSWSRATSRYHSGDALYGWKHHGDMVLTVNSLIWLIATGSFSMAIISHRVNNDKSGELTSSPLSAKWKRNTVIYPGTASKPSASPNPLPPLLLRQNFCKVSFLVSGHPIRHTGLQKLSR